MNRTINLPFGTYRAPRVRIGDMVRCEHCRRRVKIEGVSAGRIAWPVCRPSGQGGRLLPVLTGDLVNAVKQESVQTVALYWGVSRWTVQRWRRVLGVGRMTEGTLSLWRHLCRKKLPRAVALRGASRGGVATAIIRRRINE